MTRAAAFFDLDRTLMAGSSGMHFARAAYRAGMVSRPLLARWGLEHVRFRLRGSTDERTAQVLSQVKQLLAGVPEREIARMGPDLLAGVLPRIYPPMLEEVRAHQDAGRATFIVSAAGNSLVEILAMVLGMDGGIGTSYEVDPDGVLTGRIVEPFVYGEGKVQAMRAFATDHEIDLGSSWAYSDSASDLPMLRAVGSPVAVNPDPELNRIAESEAWRVMRFEKLGRRLTIAGATVVAAAVGGMGTMLARRRPAPAGLCSVAGPVAERPAWRHLDSPHGRGARIQASRARVDERGVREAGRARRPFETISGQPVKALYTQDDLADWDPERDLGYPGEHPYTRASTPRCIAAACGRCASLPASARPRRRTSASATCSTTGRPGSRPRSTCRL